MIDLNKYKDHKRNLMIKEDLLTILRIYHLSMEALKPYHKYKPVMETISNLQNQKTILELHFGKFDKLVKEYDGKLEEIEE